MALSNIFREPRRELTEQIAGLIVVGGGIYLDHFFADWFFAQNGGKDHFYYVFGYFIGLALFGFFVLAMLTVHAVGEGICNSLADRGLELRPKNRPNGAEPNRNSKDTK